MPAQPAGPDSHLLTQLRFQRAFSIERSRTWRSLDRAALRMVADLERTRSLLRLLGEGGWFSCCAGSDASDLLIGSSPALRWTVGGLDVDGIRVRWRRQDLAGRDETSGRDGVVRRCRDDDLAGIINVLPELCHGRGLFRSPPQHGGPGSAMEPRGQCPKIERGVCCDHGAPVAIYDAGDL